MSNLNFNKVTTDLQTFDWSRYLTPAKIIHQFAIGFITCIFGASLWSVLVMHLVWELFTNSEWGREWSKKYLGSDLSDHSWAVLVADNVLFTLGWLAAYFSCGQGSMSMEQIYERFRAE